MAAWGHEYGLISTFFTTWVLRTDGKGKVWISEGIANSAVGSESQVSVTQVRVPLRTMGASCRVICGFW